MEKLNNSKEKLQPAIHPYEATFKLLKSGSEKIKRDLRKSRRIRFCGEAEIAREHLNITLKSIPDSPKVGHIQLLAVAIRNVVFLLDQTQKDFHSKEFMRIREYAENLLEEAWENIPR
jgi:hypothetical protein